MKPIRGLSETTPGLSRYLRTAGDGASWKRFRKRGRAYGKLIAALVEQQHGLCGYCEMDLLRSDRQVEHVTPRSDPGEGKQRELDFRNLIACCKGGTERAFDSEGAHETSRFLPPVRAHWSRGQAKEDRANGILLDPRTLPPQPALFAVLADGRIEPDLAACVAAGIPAERVEGTIERLNLNAGRLRAARAARWTGLDEEWGEELDDEGMIQAAARTEMLPDDEGRLRRFFTTSRSYFAADSPAGSPAERMLAEPPQHWI